jgi:hypothetical protein
VSDQVHLGWRLVDAEHKLKRLAEILGPIIQFNDELRRDSQDKIVLMIPLVEAREVLELLHTNRSK